MTDASGIDENTGELRFGGPDFDAEAGAIHILSNAQVAVILQASANNAMVSDQEVTDAYNQALKYVDRFNQMANKEKDNQEIVDELDNLQDALSNFRTEQEDGEEVSLHPFEVSALMNLVIADTTVEEAQALIPSLTRFGESATDEILELIKVSMMRIVS